MGKKKVVKKGKKPHKNKKPSKKYKKYTIEGSTLKKGKFCPRCGPGVFLLNSKERSYCGKCHFTEFHSQNKVEK